jgi:hypothetical protein
MAGGGLTVGQRWFEEQSAGAPATLRECSAGYLVGREPERAEQLAEAAQDALNAVLARPGDRSVALDLLAADALLTLALKARAREAPAELARFAATLRARRGSPR